ncbi:MAG TPA: hypothetical protein VLG47_00470 [Candidatus Saccharimonadales bacterium]|nr:hypothetical protein [Candidatus Saccharimonadales bacterium]
MRAKKNVKSKRSTAVSNPWQSWRNKQRMAIVFVVVAVGFLVGVIGFRMVNSSDAATGNPICMALHPSLCLVSYGPYHFEEVGYQNHSNWSRISVGYSTYMFQNNAGNCLRVANDGYKVEVGTENCTTSINADKWYLKGSPASYYNAAHNCYLSVNNAGSVPRTVYCWHPVSGVDAHWTY